MTGVFVAKRLSTLSNTEGKSQRPQYIDVREEERAGTGWLIK
jgi:hypothetical protein